MRIKLHCLFSLSILVLYCYFNLSGCLEVEHDRLLLNQPILIENQAMKSTKYYEFQIESRPEVQLPQELYIFYSPVNVMTMSKIFLSFEDPAPLSEEKSDKYVNGTGFKSITVQTRGKNVSRTTNTLFFLSISCSDLAQNCSYRLEVKDRYKRSLYIDELEYIAQVDQFVNFNFQVMMPQIPCCAHYQFTLTSQPTDTNFFDLSAHIPKEKRVATYTGFLSSYSSKSLMLAHPSDSHALQSETYCENCNISFTIYSNSNRKLTFTITKFPDNLLSVSYAANKQYAIESNGNLTMKLDLFSMKPILQENNGLSIRIEPAVGRMTLYAHLNKAPDHYKDYHWSQGAPGKFALVISSKDLMKLVGSITPSSQLYITATGTNMTTFGFLIDIERFEPRELRFGYSEGGAVLLNQPVHYVLTNYGFSERSIYIKLYETSGKPYFLIKSCASRENCSISSSEAAKAQRTNRSNFPIAMNKSVVYSSVRVAEGSIITFSSQSNTCKSENSTSCSYAIAVINNGSSSLEEYLILANLHKEPRSLTPSFGLFTQIDHGDSEYFVFKPAQSCNGGEVELSIQPRFGEISFVISNHSKFPNDAISPGDFASRGLIKKRFPTSSKENVYISVTGETMATFTITAFLRCASPVTPSTGPQFISSSLATHSSKDCKPLLLNIQPPKASESNETRKYLLIDYWSPRGNHHVELIRKNDSSSAKNFTWKGGKNMIYIDDTDPWFSSSGRYMANVTFDIDFPNEPCEISIAYTTSTQLFVLSANVPYQLSIPGNMHRRFGIQTSQRTYSLTLIKKNENVLAKVDTYLSFVKSNQDPNETNYDLVLPQSKESLKIDAIAYFVRSAKECSKNARYATNCPYYISIFNREAQEQNIYLFLYNDKNKMQLKKNTPFVVPIPTSEYEPIQGSYQVANREDLNKTFEIHAEAEADCDILIMANVHDTPYSYYDERNWPTRGRYHYLSNPRRQESSSQNQVTLKISDLQEYCSKALNSTKNSFECNILIVVYVRLKHIDLTSGYSNMHPDLLTLTVAEYTLPMEVNTLYARELHSYRYSYFYLKLPWEKHNTSMYFSPINYGHPMILISYDTQRLPTLENHDERFQVNHSGILALKGGDTNSTDRNKAMVLGIYDSLPIKYMLSVTLNSQRVIEAIAGKPLEINTEDDMPTYVKLLNPKGSKKMKVTLNIDLNPVDVLIRVTNSTNRTSNELPSEAQHEWSIKEVKGIRDIDITALDKKYCENCYYIIGLFPTSQKVSASCLWWQEDIFIRVPNGKSFFYQLEANVTYRFEFVPEIKGEIQLEAVFVAYSGIPEIYAHQNPAVSENIYLFRNHKQTKYPVISFSLDNNRTLKMKEKSEVEKYEDWKGEKRYTSSNAFYFTLRSPSFALCSLLASLKEEVVQLRDGVTEFGTFQIGTKRVYHFYTIDSSTNIKYIDLIFAIYNDDWYYTEKGGVSATKLRPKLPHIEVFFINATQNENNASSSYNVKFKHKYTQYSFEGYDSVLASVHLSFPYQPGRYRVQIENSDFTAYNFSIEAKHRSIQKLPLSIEQIGRVNFNSPNFYQIYFEQEGFAVIELSECVGQVEIGLSQDEKDSSSHDENSFKKLDWNHQTGFLRAVYPVQQGTLYLRVNAMKPTNETGSKEANENKNAIFKILVSFEKLKPSSQDMLDFTRVIPHSRIVSLNSQFNAYVKWDDVIERNENRSNVLNTWNLQITYRVVSADSLEKAASFALCGIFHEESNQNLTDQGIDSALVWDSYSTIGKAHPAEWINPIRFNQVFNKTSFSVVATIVGQRKNNILESFTQRVRYQLLPVNEIELLDQVSKQERNFYFSIFMCMVIIIVIILVLYKRKRAKREEPRIQMVEISSPEIQEDESHESEY